MNLFDSNADPIYSAEAYREFRLSPAAIKRAVTILRALEQAVTKLEPFTVAAVATARNPSLGMEAALTQLEADIAAGVAMLRDFQGEADADLTADRARLAPLVEEAGRRMFEAVKRSADLSEMLSRGQSIAEAQRKRLAEAGLSGENLDKMAPPFDPAPMEAERAQCDATERLMSAFIHSKDVALLPADFEVRAALDNPLRGEQE